MRLLYVIALLIAAMMPTGAAACPELLNHKFTTLQGEQLDLCRHAGRPILVVNTASKCGYTPQFEKLEALNRKHKHKLLVVGFPSNDFNQELATNKEIAQFLQADLRDRLPDGGESLGDGRGCDAVLPATARRDRSGPAVELSQIPDRARWKDSVQFRGGSRARFQGIAR